MQKIFKISSKEGQQFTRFLTTKIEFLCEEIACKTDKTASRFSILTFRVKTKKCTFIVDGPVSIVLSFGLCLAEGRWIGNHGCSVCFALRGGLCLFYNTMQPTCWLISTGLPKKVSHYHMIKKPHGIVLNHVSEIRFIRHIEVWIKNYKYLLVVDILCIYYSLTSVTIPEPQTSDMRQIR